MSPAPGRPKPVLISVEGPGDTPSGGRSAYPLIGGPP